MNIAKVIVLGLLGLVLSGCILTPNGLEKEGVDIFSLKQLEETNQLCECKNTNKTVRLGGKVLSATALEKQTKLEILSMPILPVTAKPNLDFKSDGRFVVYLPQFVDPEILKEQYITVKGVVTQYQKGKIDLYDYEYPVIEAKSYQLWHRVLESYYDEADLDDWRRNRAKGLFFWKPEPKTRFKLEKY